MKVMISAPRIFLGSTRFSRVERMLALGLSGLGMDIRVVNTAIPRYDGIIAPSEYRELTELTKKDFKPDIYITVAPNCEFIKYPECYNIGISMWETNRLPPFGQNCGFVDEVWVPSPFNQQIFKESGYIAPEKVFMMPFGIDTNLFSPAGRVIRITDHLRTLYNFVYGIVCNYSTRKGLDLILTAHHELFTTGSGVALFIKGDTIGTKTLPNDVGQLKSGNPIIDVTGKSPEFVVNLKQRLSINNAIVLFDFTTFDDSTLVALYRSLDLFVFPSRGEGFGYPPLEAMSCEVPVIGTAETGMKEYMLEDISYPIRSNRWVVDHRTDWVTGNYVNHQFADPDYEQYRDLVYHVYTHREEAKEKAKKAREFVLQNYSYSVVLSKVRQRLEGIVSPELKEVISKPVTKKEGTNS